MGSDRWGGEIRKTDPWTMTDNGGLRSTTTDQQRRIDRSDSKRFPYPKTPNLWTSHDTLQILQQFDPFRWEPRRRVALLQRSMSPERGLGAVCVTVAGRLRPEADTGRARRLLSAVRGGGTCRRAHRSPGLVGTVCHHVEQLSGDFMPTLWPQTTGGLDAFQSRPRLVGNPLGDHLDTGASHPERRWNGEATFAIGSIG